MNIHTSNQNWDLLIQLLPPGWEDQAKSLGALQRQRKFSNAAQLLRLLLIHLADGCSLRETVVRSKQGNLISVSDVALLKRLRAASEWFRWMTIQMLNNKGVSIGPPEYIRDYKVKLIDASTISEPGSTGTDWRLHYSFELFTLKCDQFIVSRQNTGESFVNFRVDPDDLLIGDRAYGRLRGFQHVLNHGGHFLVRLKNKAFNIYTTDGHKLDLLQHVTSLRIGQVGEFDIIAKVPTGKDITMRLLAVRKSDDAAAKSIKRAIREQKWKQQKVNPQTLALHHYVILATSLPNTITGKQIADLYRLRWQIEIAFKRLKSIMGLGHLPKTDKQSCCAWLHGKLFVAQLVQSIVDEGSLFSPWGYPIQA